jgi:hypothetical protein
MGIPLELSFVVFTSLGAVLFAASSAGALTGRGSTLLLPVTAVALLSMLVSVVSVWLYLGHPERIFGAIVNPQSVFSRELIALFVVVILMVIVAYRLFRGMTVAKPLSAVAVVMAFVLLVFTAQLVHFWVSHRIMIGGAGAGT